MQTNKTIEAPWHNEEPQYFGPETRSLFLSGPINSDSTKGIISQLLELNARSEDIIKLYLNTSGGNLTDAFAIYDTIKAIKAPVHTIVKGMCASGGLIVLLAGSKRFASKNSLFFYHQPVMFLNQVSSIEQSNGLSEAYNLSKALFDGKIITETKIELKLWDENFKGRTYKYFNSKEAKSFGFINGVIQYDNGSE